jgi:hypothetical protein
MITADFVSFAEELAMAARLESLPRRARGCLVETKASLGFDPVIEGDRAAESAMRKLIASRFPDHSAEVRNGQIARGGARQVECAVNGIAERCRQLRA